MTAAQLQPGHRLPCIHAAEELVGSEHLPHPVPASAEPLACYLVLHQTCAAMPAS